MREGNAKPAGRADGAGALAIWSPPEAPTLSSRPLLLPIVVITACSFHDRDKSADDDTAATSSDAFAIEFVTAHNAARGRAEPTPDPALPDVTWDDDLAVYAQQWSGNCVFEHSTGETGENIAVDSRSVRPTDIVDYWFSEISDYNYEKNTCARNAQCGHYTQIVWRDTAKIGCAKTVCSNIPDFGAGEFWVCEYDPPGNWVGERPY